IHPPLQSNWRGECGRTSYAGTMGTVATRERVQVTCSRKRVDGRRGRAGQAGGREGPCCGVAGAPDGSAGDAAAGEGAVSVWPRRRRRSAGDQGWTAAGRQGKGAERTRLQAQAPSRNETYGVRQDEC